MNIVEFKNLSSDQAKLVEEAKKAKNLAYAPYSEFQVGTAILMDDGQILKGANQENASYPLCLCAERVALSYAAMHCPTGVISSMAISTSADLGENDVPAPPCGACRQVLMEYQSRQKEIFDIILIGCNDKCWIYPSVYPLLPHSFNHDFMK